MDTSESKPGSSGASTTSAAPPQAASADTFKESDVANIVSMGFAREVGCFVGAVLSCKLPVPFPYSHTELMFQVAIAELRKCNGDANMAVANLFAKSLSEGFNKKK